MYLTSMYQEKGIPYLVQEREIVFNAKSPDYIYEGMCRAFKADKLPEEHVWLLCVDTALQPTAIHEISKGTINYSVVDNKAIMTRALLSGSYGIIVIHNHPSGNIVPSKEDDDVCKKINKASKLLGIALLDFIIVGKGYLSYANEGII